MDKMDLLKNGSWTKQIIFETGAEETGSQQTED